MHILLQYFVTFQFRNSQSKPLKNIIIQHPAGNSKYVHRSLPDWLALYDSLEILSYAKLGYIISAWRSIIQSLGPPSTVIIMFKAYISTSTLILVISVKVESIKTKKLKSSPNSKAASPLVMFWYFYFICPRKLCTQ